MWSQSRDGTRWWTSGLSRLVLMNRILLERCRSLRIPRWLHRQALARGWRPPDRDLFSCRIKASLIVWQEHLTCRSFHTQKLSTVLCILWKQHLHSQKYVMYRNRWCTKIRERTISNMWCTAYKSVLKGSITLDLRQKFQILRDKYHY